MRIIFLLSLALLLQLSAFSQPSIQWQKSLGGTGYDAAYSIQPTSDGGYVVAGESDSNDGDVTGNHGDADFWIVKLTANMGIQWQKSLGGSDYDASHAIQQTSDGGFVVAGESYSNDSDVSGNHGLDDCWIVKLSAGGDIQWQKCLGGSNNEIAYSIHQTTDGGYIMAGTSASNDGDVSGNHGGYDYWVVKLDSVGSIQWQKSLGGTNYDAAQSVQQTFDGGYIVAGYTLSNDGDVSGNHDTTGNYYDYWIVKLLANGAIQWRKCLGGTGDDEAFSIHQTLDGNYIVAGESNSNNGNVSSNHGNFDYWIVNLNGAGGIQWQKCLGGTSYDNAFSISLTQDGGYIVAGEGDSNDNQVTGNHGGGDYWIVKMNSIGSIQWQKCLGGTSGDYAYSILQTADGGYVVAGESYSNDGDVSGHHGSIGAVDYWVVKLSPNNDIDEPDAMRNELHIYPNPMTSSSILQLNTQVKDAEVIIYDMVGKEMMRKKLAGDKMEIERGGLVRGIYFVRVVSEEGQWAEKLVVE